MASSQPLPLRRLAAEALGRIGDPAAIPSLLRGLELAKNHLRGREANDRGLDHALTYALIEIGPHADTLLGLTSSDPSGPPGRARGPRSERRPAESQGRAGELARRRPWPARVGAVDCPPASGMEQRADWLLARAASGPRQRARTSRSSRSAGAARQDEATQSLLADAVRSAEASPGPARIALRAMARSGLKELPAAWVQALAASAVARSPILGEVLATARAVTPPKKGAERPACRAARAGRCRQTAARAPPGGAGGRAGRTIVGVGGPMGAARRTRRSRPAGDPARRRGRGDLVGQAHHRPAQRAGRTARRRRAAGDRPLARRVRSDGR